MLTAVAANYDGAAMSSPHHPLFARMYDIVMMPSDRMGIRRQRRHLCRRAAGIVLELGVGTGLNLPHYERADTVVAVDHDQGMLSRADKRARESIVDVHLIAADAHGLPFADNSFDTIVVGLSLCTIPDPDQSLVEALRVATPDGELHFLEHVRATHSTRVAHFEDRIAPFWGKVAGGCRPNQDTARIIDDAGWEISELWQSDRGGLIQGTAVPKAPN